MTDEVIQPSPVTEHVSTTLESDVTPKTSGGGKITPPPVEEAKPEVPAKAESVRDSLKAELDKTKEPEKVEKPVKAEKLEEEPKPVAKTEAKSATPEKEVDASEQVKDQQTERKSEFRDRPEPPARFLPRAKELWRNTPNEVQSEVSRLVREHETEVQQYRESHQFREELKEYEELGKQHGVSVKQALDNYVGIERKFAESPPEGFRQLLSNLNMQPQQAISHILRAFNVTPQQLAQHISADPNSYVSQAPQVQPQQQPQINPEVETLKRQNQAMQEQMAAFMYIEPFAKEHPRYYELEQDIAFFLQSGKIPANLSPAEKLEAAYDMAERINPSSNVSSFSPKQTSSESRVDEDFNGSKSIKSSPGNVLEVKEPDKKMSMRELLEDELKRLKKA
ncbi:hypothetical protein [Brucella phage Fi]|uniref:Structural protein n=3 Tax=root TaxID=1 RepID=H2EI53_9CAUD|nr:virion structural protein [Brucella phage Tb]AHB81132.1 structural protein [Brucella phage Fz]CCP90054.1 hypothetical protein [Brucella phage Fi]AEY69685.1 Structural protein [Brucella phage Tb]AHB81299.1 structural protein [Brucella phage Tb]CCP51186.1 hypothetical protein [Brucella phage Tb]